MQDKEIVEAIKSVAQHYGLELDYRQNGGSFRTVYFCAPSDLPGAEQQRRLEYAQRALKHRGVVSNLTQYDNPAFFNKNIGKMVDGHPRHGDPLIEIDSVWWDKQG